jgi:hypothetical protein
VVVVLVLLAVPAHADYLSDRGLPDAAAQWDGRLYLARTDGIAFARSWTVDQIVAKYGPPDERRPLAASAEILVYHGKKTLYRGTLRENVAVGPEWKEILVEQGVPRKETLIVQVLDVNSPLPGYHGRPHCEPYGSAGRGFCFGIEPNGPVPAMPPLPDPPKDFDCPAGPPPPMSDRTASAVSREMLKQVFSDVAYASNGREEFLLAFAAPPTLPLADRPPPPLILGQDLTQRNLSEAGFRQATCATAVALHVISRGNQRGTLVAAICDRAAELRWSDVCDAKAGVGRLLFALGGKEQDALGQMPILRPRHHKLRTGLEAHYFGVMLVGHGIGFLPTAVVTSPASRSAIVVQFQGDNFCAWGDEPWQMCGDPQGTFMKMAVGLARRLLDA